MLFLTLFLFLASVAANAQDSFSSVERIVAVGDVHGDFDAFVTILRDAGVIDDKNRWSGGKTHFVQTGDILDRGPSSRKVMDLLQALEKQAPKEGGRVHSLIGNHEIMNMMGDLRYVIPEEYAAFKTRDSQRVRDAFWEEEIKTFPRPPSKEEKAKWEAEHPLGWVEHRMQFGSEGAYGKWIRAKNAIVKINDSVFLHGGISPKFLGKSISDINTTVRQEIKNITKIKADTAVVTDPDGPFWYRGLAQESGPAIDGHAAQVIEALGVKRIVVGHTPMPGAIFSRLGGKVVLIDVGLSAYYGGNRACLIIENGKLYAMHRGQKLELPGNDGPDFLAYLKKAAALESPTSSLTKFVSAFDK